MRFSKRSAKHTLSSRMLKRNRYTISMERKALSKAAVEEEEEVDSVANLPSSLALAAEDVVVLPLHRPMTSSETSLEAAILSKASLTMTLGHLEEHEVVEALSSNNKDNRREEIHSAEWEWAWDSTMMMTTSSEADSEEASVGSAAAACSARCAWVEEEAAASNKCRCSLQVLETCQDPVQCRRRLTLKTASVSLEQRRPPLTAMVTRLLKLQSRPMMAVVTPPRTNIC